MSDIETTETPTETVEAVEAPVTEEAKFTQADMDRVVQKRLAQEAKKTADYEDLKTKLQSYEDAQKTEAQKAQEAASEWEKKYAALETQVKQSEIKAAVAQVNETTLSTDKLLRLLDIDDAADAGDAVKAFLAENPQLAKTPTAAKAPGAAKTSDAANIDPKTNWKEYVAAKTAGAALYE